MYLIKCKKKISWFVKCQQQQTMYLWISLIDSQNEDKVSDKQRRDKVQMDAVRVGANVSEAAEDDEDEEKTSHCQRQPCVCDNLETVRQAERVLNTKQYGYNDDKNMYTTFGK